MEQAVYSVVVAVVLIIGLWLVIGGGLRRVRWAAVATRLFEVRK